MACCSSVHPVWWGMLVLAGVALVAPSESQGARPPSAGCPGAERAPLPPTLSGLRLTLRVPPCHPLSRPLRAARPSTDQWLARDKAKHVAFSGLWTLSTQYVLVNKADWSKGDALPLSITSSATVGLAKELYDASRPAGTISGKDLAADAVGIGLAVGVILL